MRRKRTRFPTITKQYLPIYGKEPKRQEPSHDLHSANRNYHHHLHLHHPPPTSTILHFQYVVSLSSSITPFSFPTLYNCFFTWKRRTFPTVEGSFPISHFLALRVWTWPFLTRLSYHGIGIPTSKRIL